MHPFIATSTILLNCAWLAYTLPNDISIDLFVFFKCPLCCSAASLTASLIFHILFTNDLSYSRYSSTGCDRLSSALSRWLAQSRLLATCQRREQTSELENSAFSFRHMPLFGVKMGSCALISRNRMHYYYSSTWSQSSGARSEVTGPGEVSVSPYWEECK